MKDKELEEQLNKMLIPHIQFATIKNLIAQERRKAKIEVLEWVLLATRPENTEYIFDLLDELKEDKE